MKRASSRAAAAGEPPRVLIADDHAVVRRGMRQILAEHFPKAVFGEAANAREALERAGGSPWDIVLLDLEMPCKSCLDMLRDLRQARPGVAVLAVGARPECAFAIRILKAGANGYIGKEADPEEMARAVRKLLAGGKYVSTRLAEKLVESLQSGGGGAPHESLSDREYEVMTRIAAGKGLKEIAGSLGLSVKTVSTYRTRVLAKMGLKTTAEIIRYAISNRLVD